MGRQVRTERRQKGRWRVTGEWRQGTRAGGKGRSGDRRRGRPGRLRFPPAAIGAVLGGGLVLVLLVGSPRGPAIDATMPDAPTSTIAAHDIAAHDIAAGTITLPTMPGPPPQPRPIPPGVQHGVGQAQSFLIPPVPDLDAGAVPDPPAAAPAPPPALQRDDHRDEPVPPAPGSGGPPRIVVVIDDMGVDRRRSAAIAALPGPLTLAWLPYADDLRDQAAAARTRGHEAMLHLPMEPMGPGDPGPNALLTRLAPDDLRRRLEVNLSALDGIVGVNNHMGSRFTADTAGMELVMAALAGRGLFFLDSRTTPESVAGPLARRHGLAFAARDVFLDHVATAPAVAAALARLESEARRQGMAIGIGHPYDVTRAALGAWLPTLSGKGFQLVPLSAVVGRAPGGS